MVAKSTSKHAMQADTSQGASSNWTDLLGALSHFYPWNLALGLFLLQPGRHFFLHGFSHPEVSEMKFNLGGAHWDLGWSLVMPQFRIRCQGGFISWWIWSSISKIGDNNAAGYKRISVVAEKPWYITVMSGFMNAFFSDISFLSYQLKNIIPSPIIPS